jgi:DNA-binding NarL/FixJ family response regulator/anti-sigma regulatory factor (Ser/Thr protein kinase)
MESGATRVLVLNQSAKDRQTIAQALGKHEDLSGVQLVHADQGRDALLTIAREPPAAVLTDLGPADMTGLEFLEEVRAQHPSVPVIVMTSPANEKMAVKALRTGAASYVPCRLLKTELAQTLQSVLTLASRQRDRSRIVACLKQTAAEFCLDSDRSLVAPLVRYLEECTRQLGVCDEADRMRVGVALEEALLNAIYHGNLEVASVLREVDDETFYRQVELRQTQTPYRERRLYVRVELTREEARYVIRDEGPGFDVSILPDPTDPTNLGKVSGRGVLLMRTFMDEVHYNTRGNEVTLIKRHVARQHG